MEAPIDISTITNPNWQMSNTTFGQVAIGENDLQMCVHNILFTRKGEMPLNMNAGSDLYKLIDQPMSVVYPGVTKEVINAIETQEPRLKVTSVVPTFSPVDGSVSFQINMQVVNTNQFLGYTLSLTKSNQGQRAWSDGFTTDFS